MWTYLPDRFFALWLYLLYLVAKPRTMSCVSCHVPASRELLPPLSPVMLNRDSDASCHPILGFCVCEFSLSLFDSKKNLNSVILWDSKNNKISTDGAVRHLHGGLFGGWWSCLHFSLPPSFSPSNILFCFWLPCINCVWYEVQGDDFPCAFSVHGKFSLLLSPSPPSPSNL